MRRTAVSARIAGPPGDAAAAAAAFLALAALLAAGMPARAQEASAGGAAPAAAAPAPAAAAPAPAASPASGQPVGGIGGLGGVPAVNLARPSDVRLGGFTSSPFGGGPVNLSGTTPTRGYVIEPLLTLRLLATDNNHLEDRQRDAEFVTSVIPELRVTAETALFRGSFGYAPSINIYANGTEDNRVDHYFFGAGTLTLVPESVFVDMRAFGTVTPLSPGLNDANVATSRRGAFTRDYYATLSPYAIQRWGSTATSIVGYRFAYSRSDGDAFQPVAGGPSSPGDNELVTHTGFAAIRSGEDFGRFVLEARTSGTLYSGGGDVTDGAERALAVVEARYVIIPSISVLGEVGYEHLDFGGLTPYRVDGMVWGGGIRLDPGPNTMIIVRYRRRDGFDAPMVEARVALGPRTVFYGSYLEEVTTSLAQVSDLLSTVTVDEFGNPVALSGAPVPELGGTNFLGQQDGLFRSRRGTASLSHVLPRDTLTLQYTYDRRTPLSWAAGDTVYEQETQSISLLWRRDVGPVTTAFGSVGYNWTEYDSVIADDDTITARIGVVHQFSERLVGSLQYQFTQRLSSRNAAPGVFAPGDATQNTVIASVTARF